MKLVLAGVLVLLLLLLLVFIWHLPPKNRIETNQLTSKTDTNETGASASVRQLPKRLAGGVPEDPQMEEFRRKEEIDPQWARKLPVEFYGKVIDESGMPLEGVKVAMSLLDLSPDGTSDSTRVTDSEGLFSLQGVFGQHLIVKLEKYDYYSTQSNPYSFEYA